MLQTLKNIFAPPETKASRTAQVIALGHGGHARWTPRDYAALAREGYGVRDLDALAAVVAFYEERRGQLYGFRWRDRIDHASCAPGATPAATDQMIGTGDGTTSVFALTKTYGATFAPYQRAIAKPVAGSVRVAAAGTVLTEGTHFSCDTTTGLATFLSGHIPAAGQAVTAGFLFDVPVRFDTDYLEVDLSAFAAGQIPKIPLVEIKP